MRSKHAFCLQKQIKERKTNLLSETQVQLLIETRTLTCLQSFHPQKARYQAQSG